jgi:hypothetical protein
MPAIKSSPKQGGFSSNVPENLASSQSKLVRAKPKILFHAKPRSREAAKKTSFASLRLRVKLSKVRSTEWAIIKIQTRRRLCKFTVKSGFCNQDRNPTFVDKPSSRFSLASPIARLIWTVQRACSCSQTKSYFSSMLL